MTSTESVSPSSSVKCRLPSSSLAHVHATISSLANSIAPFHRAFVLPGSTLSTLAIPVQDPTPNLPPPLSWFRILAYEQRPFNVRQTSIAFSLQSPRQMRRSWQQHGRRPLLPRWRCGSCRRWRGVSSASRRLRIGSRYAEAVARIKLFERDGVVVMGFLRWNGGAAAAPQSP